MTSFIGVTESQSDPFAPLTSELVKQLRDNPIAQMEGATGSPEIHTNWVPYNVVSGGTGVIWDYSVDGAVGVVETPNFESRFEYKLFAENLTINDASLFGVFAYMDVADTYNALTDLGGEPYSLSLSETDGRTLDFVIKRPDKSSIFHMYEYYYPLPVVGAGIATPTLNRRLYGHSANDTISKLKIETKTAGSRTLESGKVYLYRRLCFETR